MNPIRTFEDLIASVSAYRQSMIIITSIRLRIFDHIHSGKRDLITLSSITGISPDRLEILLNALVVLGLLRKDGSYYYNTEVSEKYLSCSSEMFAGSIILHNIRCWRGWTDLLDTLYGDFRQSRMSDDERRYFIDAMDVISKKRVPLIIDKLNLPERSRLLDLGGGPGTYAMEFKKNYPELDVIIFDLSEVIDITEEYLKKGGYSGLIKTIRGDFLTGTIGSSYDVVWISQVIHMLTEKECSLVFEKVYNALNHRGKIIIHDFFLSDDGLHPEEAVIFGLHMIAVNGKGKTYRFYQIEELLSRIGFKGIKRHPFITPATSLITAEKE